MTVWALNPGTWIMCTVKNGNNKNWNKWQTETKTNCRLHVSVLSNETKMDGVALLHVNRQWKKSFWAASMIRHFDSWIVTPGSGHVEDTPVIVAVSNSAMICPVSSIKLNLNSAKPGKINVAASQQSRNNKEAQQKNYWWLLKEEEVCEWFRRGWRGGCRYNSDGQPASGLCLL